MDENFYEPRESVIDGKKVMMCSLYEGRRRLEELREKIYWANNDVEVKKRDKKNRESKKFRDNCACTECKDWVPN